MTDEPPSELIDWLMASAPYVRYRTRLDLLGESKEAAAGDLGAAMDDPKVRSMVEECCAWPWRPLVSHRSAGHPLHKLSFLAELGLDAGDARIRKLAEAVLERAAPDGPLRVTTKPPLHFGGSGREEWTWYLCDAPQLTSCLARFGLGGDRRVQASVKRLLSMARDNGWPCAVSPELGKFRGPGRKDDPCPYANLLMLELVSIDGRHMEGREARTGLEAQLGLWERSRELHPYMFYMGTDFRKLKAPFVWYDIMHVAEVLSRFPSARKDERLRDMASAIIGKADGSGRYAPESIWTDWKGWDFGQKKAPSPWLTLCALRIQARMGL